MVAKILARSVSKLESAEKQIRNQAEKSIKILFLFKERNKQLKKAKHEADTANKTKSDFLAHMSHELRSPLNAIIGFSQELKDEHPGGLNAAQKEFIGYVLDSGLYLLDLINDILDLAKVESGKIEIVKTEVNLKDLIGRSINFVKEKALHHNINLITRINDDVGTVYADEKMLKQIIFNLLSNSLKFTPDGGKVELSALRNTDGYLISVKDTGIGIGEEDKKKIFSEFEQIKNEFSDRAHGTGLGLALTKKLVEIHGGKIWFESEGKGKGTTFYFTLPL